MGQLSRRRVTLRRVLADEVKALTFDVFGTVVDWRGSIARQAREILEPKGRRLDWNAFAVAWRRLYQPYLERVRSGSRPFTGLDELQAESLEEVLKELGVKRLDPAAKRRLVQAWHTLDPWPDSPAGLERLSARYRLATLSNGGRDLLASLARHGRLHFHEILSAEDAGAYKPDPRVYRMACERLGTRPEETLMVAAHLGDLQAAGQVGLRTAFVARPREWEDAGVAEEPRPWLDLYATDLEDLARQLQAAP
jgi:2-haloacid dehalogenase